MPPRGGVIHCFTGNASSARAFLALGFYISFSGILTFRNPAQVREAALIVPTERVMVETDAPYLAPEPHRGTRNEPAYVGEVAKAIANVRNLPAEEVALATAANFRRFFRLARPAAAAAGPAGRRAPASRRADETPATCCDARSRPWSCP